MMAPLDEAYLAWLYRQVASVRLRNPNRTYWSLMRQLYRKEFVWFIPNDDNRMEDGRDLRVEFIGPDNLHDVDPEWLNLGCSMLELLIALSRRAAFEGEGEPSDWFWEMLRNLDIHDYNDATFSDFAERRTDEVLDQVIWRWYLPNGEGGLFPLHHPRQNQQEVEIWYQLNAYLLERD